MADLATITPERDFLEIRDEIHAGIRTAYPDWEANPGDLDVLIAEALARIGALLYQQLGEIGTEALRQWGLKVITIPPIFASPASVSTTWSLSDELGHSIPAGTLVDIGGPSTPERFRVVKEVVVAPGSSSTGAGAVVLQAINPGTVANGLSGPASPVTPLSWVTSISLVGLTSGGVDEEDPDDYLDRLIRKLRTLSYSLILPRNFEVDALDIAGVGRALAIRGYDVEAEKEDVPLAVGLALATAEGETLPAPNKEAVEALQRDRLLSGVKYGLLDPTYTTIDVAVEVAVLSGYDPSVVTAAVVARLREYLDPGVFARPTATSPPPASNWVRVAAVYRNELISESDRIAGVDRVVGLTLAEAEDELKVQESVALTGIAPLTKPGEITVAAV